MKESVQLFVFPSPLSPVVLGFPWWKQHNPHTDWFSASIINFLWFLPCSLHSVLWSLLEFLPKPNHLRRVTYVTFPVSIIISSKFLVKTKLNLFLHTNHMTVQYCHQGLLYPLRNFIISLPPRNKPWRNTLLSLWLPLLWSRFFLCWKEGQNCQPCIDFRGLNDCKEKISIATSRLCFCSPSWCCSRLQIGSYPLYESVSGMSGRWHSTLILDILNIW